MKRLIVTLLFLLLPVSLGCAKLPPALVEGNPTPAEVQVVRRLAVTMTANLTAGLSIADATGDLVASLPVADSVKLRYDCALLKVLGTNAAPRATTTAACGAVPMKEAAPLPRLAKELEAVTTCPSLRATLMRLLALVDPLVAQLDGGSNQSLAFAAATLRATFAFARTFLEAGGTCSL